jgi:hypothetical protein
MNISTASRVTFILRRAVPIQPWAGQMCGGEYLPVGQENTHLSRGLTLNLVAGRLEFSVADTALAGESHDHDDKL